MDSPQIYRPPRPRATESRGDTRPTPRRPHRPRPTTLVVFSDLQPFSQQTSLEKFNGRNYRRPRENSGGMLCESRACRPPSISPSGYARKRRLSRMGYTQTIPTGIGELSRLGNRRSIALRGIIVVLVVASVTPAGHIPTEIWTASSLPCYNKGPAVARRPARTAYPDGDMDGKQLAVL